MLEIAYSSFSCLLNARKQKDVLFPATLSFLIAILGILLCYVWTIRKSRKAMAPLPPGPRGLPIVGYLPFLGFDNLHMVFTKLAAAYGPIYKLWLGNKLTIVISSPSLVKEVVRDHDVAFCERDPSIAAQVITFGSNDIAFDSYSSPGWKTRRKILATDMLSNANLNACYGLRREQVMKTVWDVYKNIGKPFDIGKLAFITAINVTIGLMWGGKLRGREGAKIEGHFKDLSSEIMVLLAKPNISDIFPSIAQFDMQGIERGMKKILQSFNELFDSVIELRMNAATEKEKVDGMSEPKADFLQFLLDLHKEGEDGASSLTMNEIKGILMDTLVGGTDTASTTTEWVMAELMQHPEKMDKVKKELVDVVGLNNVVEEFHLPNLSYLNAAIKESFRMHPPLPLLFPRSLQLGGYTIPKGSRVFLNMWSIYMDPNIWDNPSEFRPERFLDDPDKFDFRGNDFRYLPFGSGRRKCPAVSHGGKMLSFILASLLHSFEWKLPQGTELELSCKFGIVVKKKTPLRLIPTPRLTNLDLYKE
ncbi:cytochrome P450, family 706, subfamily A, polypeptide 6 [Hibiscus trionum]|uniref:Cytochrome P450, family 706, subfamily A, polypeptide 6 n=1 Tax=Hibiscus trionum TaxID=183268 RepID=A0A9W7GS28_HIBTR|nr:cytochrome P450, family 706, subfamily A, polypeptide 6 [Hibiscus trionum]